MLHDQLQTTHRAFLRDLQAAERRGTAKALVVEAKVRAMVMRIIRTGIIPIEFATDIQRLYSKPVHEAMQTADLLGRKRAWLTAENAGLKLGDIHTAAVDYFKRNDQDAIGDALDAHQEGALAVVRDLASGMELKLRDAIRESVVQGEHLKDSKKRITETMDSMGLSPRNKGQIETIIRTQTQLAFAAGRWKAERLDPDIDEMLWGYKYVTAGDSRVRDEHKNLDGVVLPKDHAFWSTFMPPNGFNCRCQAIPLYDQRPVKFPPRNAEPDKTFHFNVGKVVYGDVAPVRVKPVVVIPAGAPSQDRLDAAKRAWSEGTAREDIRRLLNGEDISGVGGERARAILQALATADLNRITLFRGPSDHRSGVLEYTSKKPTEVADTLEPLTARAIKIGAYRYIVDVRK